MPDQKQKLTGRGGPGRGQGRRPIDEDKKRQNYTTKLHPDVIRWIREQGKGKGAGLKLSPVQKRKQLKTQPLAEDRLQPTAATSQFAVVIFGNLSIVLVGKSGKISNQT